MLRSEIPLLPWWIISSKSLDERSKCRNHWGQPLHGAEQVFYARPCSHSHIFMSVGATFAVATMKNNESSIEELSLEDFVKREGGDALPNV